MSRFIATSFATVLLLLSQSSLAQIQSTTAGGNWWEEATWTGSQIPGPNDDVIVNGPVSVRIGDACRNLTISAGGSVFDSPIGAATETITVNGNLENRGTLEGSLAVNVLGDLTNGGSWLPWTTNLDGTGGQALYSEGAATFGGIMVVRNTVGPVSAGSDLAFSEGSLDLRFQDFLVDGRTLKLDETAVIFGGRMVGDVTLAGTFPARGGLTMEGTVTVNGTMQDYGGGGATETIRVAGRIVNNGVVRDDLGRLAIEVDGEIRNNGVWTADHTRFVGSGSQVLSHEVGHALGGTWSMADSSVVSAADTLVFDAATVDLFNGELQMNELLLALENETLLQWGSVDTREVAVTGGSIVKGSRWLGDVTLHGNVLAGSGTLFEGSIVVNDTLQDAPGGSAIETVEVLGSVSNQGVIQGNLDLWIQQNLFNDGEWTNWVTQLTGRGRRTITGDKYETEIRIAGEEVILTGEVHVDKLAVQSTAAGRITGGASLHLPVYGLIGNIGNLVNYGRVVIRGPLPLRQITPFLHCNVVSNVEVDFDTLYVSTYGSQVPETYGSAVQNWWRFQTSSETSMTLSRATFYYSDAQLAGNDESSLEVYHSPDEGNSWVRLSTSANISRNTEENSVTIEGVPANGDFLLTSNTEPGAVVPNIITSITGTKHIRIGAPSKYLISYLNATGMPTDVVLLGIKIAPDAHILSVEVLDESGAEGKIFETEDFVVPDVIGDSLALFIVDGMDPFEERSMLVTAMADPDQAGKVQMLDPLITLIGVTALKEGAMFSASFLLAYASDIFARACKDILAEVEKQGVSRDSLATVIGSAFRETNRKWAGTPRSGEFLRDEIIAAICTGWKVNPVCQGVLWGKALGDCAIGAVAAVSKLPQREVRCPAGAFGAFGAGCITTTSNSWSVSKTRPDDPNEKVGPGGYGNQRYVSSLGRLHYTILFENKPEATAAAYRVVIHDTLEAEVDPTTVAFGPASHEGFTMSQDGNILTWDIVGIELPPNVNPPEGEGFVSFSVDPVEGLASGTAVENGATIIFDINPPISTDTFVNTLDFMGPITTMASLPPEVEDNEVVVRWESIDPNNGSGVKLANVFASLNGGSFWRVGQTSGDSLAIPIDSSGTYSFYAMGVDQVGNVESSTPQPVTTNVTTVGLDEESLPYRFELSQNYPNPFNPETVVNYTLPAMGHVRMEVFDVTGRLVVRLVDEVQTPGHHNAVWNARAVASGVYFYRLRQGERVDVRPMILIK